MGAGAMSRLPTALIAEAGRKRAPPGRERIGPSARSRSVRDQPLPRAGRRGHSKYVSPSSKSFRSRSATDVAFE